MTEQVWWYATRAAGLMAWSTAVASVLMGILLSPRLLGRRAKGTWLPDVHRFLGGLSAVFLLIHMLSLLLDSQVDFGTRDLLVPGESSWNPSAEMFGVSAVSWGIAAAYSLIAVEITSILRPYIRDHIWKAAHFLSVVTVGAGTVHAYEAGTDFDNSTAPALALSMSLIVVLASVIRMRRATGPSSPAAQAEMLEEMRQRLADLPIPPSMNEPVLELDQQAELPRREPGADEGAPIGMPWDVGSPFGGVPAGSDLVDPGLITPAGENTLLTGAGLGVPTQPEEPSQPSAPIDADSLPRAEGVGPAAASIDAVVERLGPDPFAGIQGADDEFDPGGWSGDLDSSPAEGIPGPARGEFTPHGSPLSTEPVQPPSPDGGPSAAPEPPVEQHPVAPAPAPSTPAPSAPLPSAAPPSAPAPPPAPDVFDPQALLSEIQNRAAGTGPGEPPIPAHEPPPGSVAAEPPSPAPGQPAAPVPDTTTPAPDVWEDALDSALDERLPRLPNFEPMRLPNADPQPAPQATEPPAVAPPVPPPVEPASPVVEPITPSESPTPPQPAPAPPPAADRPQPPPLPVHAVDPTTGQADEEAYKIWLVEWLAFAERYGDEAPVDPTRVDS